MGSADEFGLTKIKNNDIKRVFGVKGTARWFGCYRGEANIDIVKNTAKSLVSGFKLENDCKVSQKRDSNHPEWECVDITCENSEFIPDEMGREYVDRALYQLNKVTYHDNFPLFKRLFDVMYREGSI